VILVYSVKSYCVLKIKRNSIHFEILLQKGKNATKVAKKIYDVYGYDAVSVRVIYKASLSVFNLEILMSKMYLTLVDQSLKKSMKSWKKLSKIGTLAVMISV